MHRMAYDSMTTGRPTTIVPRWICEDPLSTTSLDDRHVVIGTVIFDRTTRLEIASLLSGKHYTASSTATTIGISSTRGCRMEVGCWSGATRLLRARIVLPTLCYETLGVSR